VHLPGLRRAREGALLTQAELAERAGVQRVTITRLELGYQAARFSTVRRLAAALSIDARDLTVPTPAASPESGP
jgi:transcriptional regulator with XRE-family HTH domain